MRQIDEIIVQQSERQSFFSQAGQIVRDKLTVIPDPPPPEPEVIVYLTLRRIEYNLLFVGGDPNNPPRGNLDPWQLAIAVQNYDAQSRRRTLPGAILDAAVFRIKILQSETLVMLQFLTDNPVIAALIQDTLRMTIDEFRDFLNNSEDWTEQE